MKSLRTFSALAMLISFSSSGDAQTTEAPARDSIPTFSFESIIVTADRIENRAANSSSAVSVIQGEELRALPVASLSDVLRASPGINVVQRDGLGRDAQIMTRGFYGGGEAEYVIVLVDGKRTNDLATGLVNWNLIPLQNIETVEIARGASSALYGDAALGGVINIITRKDYAPSTSLGIEGGGHGILNASVRTRGRTGSIPFQLSLSDERTNGYRDHSKWKGTSFGGDLIWGVSHATSLSISTMNQLSMLDDPGPLTQSEVNRDRTSSSPYYKSDGRDTKRSLTQVNHSSVLSRSAELRSSLSFNHTKDNVIRTFTNPSPIIDPGTFSIVGFYDTTQFGDTKERDVSSNEIGGAVKLNVLSEFGTVKNRFAIGVDAGYGKLTSTYYDRFSGFRDDYEQGTPSRGTMLSEGDGKRSSYAAYINNELQPFRQLTLTLGVRFDGIEDSYAGVMPETSLTASHSATSPKFGFNVRYIENAEFSGNLYGTVNRSFKTPTLDQFSDQRPIGYAIFIPTGPDSYFMTEGSNPPFSNSALKPQRGTTYDIGIYQRVKFAGTMYAEVSASVYQMDMTDEIDFDFNTFRYQNINESRHKGFEGAVKMYLLPDLTSFVNYTWTDVRFRSGANEGKYLKGIPRKVIGVGLHYQSPVNVGASVMWNSSRNTFLDDDNSHRLANYSTLGGRLQYSYSKWMAFVDVQNILDKKFSTTGYSVFGETYLFPSAGRFLRGGLYYEL